MSIDEDQVGELIRSLQQAHDDIANLKERLDRFPRRGAADSVKGWTAVGVVCVTGLFWLFNIHSKLEHHVGQNYHPGARSLNDTLIEVRTNQRRILQDIDEIKKGMKTKL